MYTAVEGMKTKTVSAAADSFVAQYLCVYVPMCCTYMRYGDIAIHYTNSLRYSKS